MSQPSPRGGGQSELPLLALAGMAGLLLLPGLAVGAAAAAWLRSLRLAWTWTLPWCVTSVIVGVLAGPPAVMRLESFPDRVAVGDLSVAEVVAAGWVPWLVVAPWAAGWWMRRRDRRDRLHGGHAQRRAELARGPVELLRTRRAGRPDRQRLLSPAGILLGTDDRGGPVRVPRPHAHVTIVGASGSGKTTTARLLLHAQAAADGAVVVLDGKGGRDLPHTLHELGHVTGRPVALWSPTPYGDAGLDGLRRVWNPCGEASATEVKDRIATAEPQTEPYYAAIASRGLLAATHALTLTGEPITLPRLAGLLDQPPNLLALLHTLPGDEMASEVGWLTDLSEKERSALRGIGTRLATMTACEPGRWLTPTPHTPELSLTETIREGGLVCFSLPQGALPELVPHVGRYLLAALNSLAGTLEQAGRPADCLVLVDELSAFDGELLASGLERGRSAGLRYVLATQSLSNFDTSGGPALAAAALDNAELILVHRQADPASVDTLAGLGGTREAWEHTHKVTDRPTPFASDEPGDRNRRLTNQYRAHPDTIKQLPTGQAILIQTRPCHHVQRVRIRAVDQD